MIDTVVGLIVSVGLFMAAIVIHPHRARCPRSYYLDAGIQPSGVYSCVPDLVGGEDAPAGRVDLTYQPPGFYQSKIYCTGGLLPVVTDEGRTVGCRRGYYQ